MKIKVIFSYVTLLLRLQLSSRINVRAFVAPVVMVVGYATQVRRARQRRGGDVALVLAFRADSASREAVE